jgi:hypothetical protein
MAKHTDDKDGATLHPLVGKVVSDPEDLPEVVVVVGYLGAAANDRPANYRIYTDLFFRTYYELLQSDVLYAEEADPTDLEQPTRIFIKASAKLTLNKALEASYLQGSIASNYPLGSRVYPYCSTAPTCGEQPCSGEHPNTHGCSPSNPSTVGCGSGEGSHTHGCSASNPNTVGCGGSGEGSHTPGYGAAGPGRVPRRTICSGEHPNTSDQ